MPKLDELRSTKGKLIASATELVNKGQHASDEFARITAELDVVESDINVLTTIEKYEAEARANSPVPVAAPAIISERDSAEHRAKVNEAARRFFGHGASSLTKEQRALLTTTDSAGGALVSQRFDDVFIEASKWFSPIFNLCHRKDTTNGAPTKFVMSDFTNQTFSVIGEGTGSVNSTAQQPTVSSDINNTSTLVSAVTYSVQELDEAFELESFLRRNAALAVSRAWEHIITTGQSNDGSNTALAASPVGGLGAFIGTGATTGALASGIGYDDFINLISSVDHAYFAAPNSAFFVSANTWNYLASLKDSTSRNYYNIDPVTGTLSVLGKPVWANAAMPDYTQASAKAVWFGDFSRLWNVLNAGVRIQVVSEENPSLSFLTRQMRISMRIGQSAGLASAAKALTMAAS